MKKSLLIAVGISLIAFGANAQFMEKDNQTVRLDYIYHDDALGSSANGIEIGFGTALYDLEDAGIFFSHIENDSVEMQALGLSIEKYWPIGGLGGLMPTAAAGTGYGWTDVGADGDNTVDIDRGGWFARLDLGLKLKVCEWFAFNATARLHYSTHEIYPDADEMEDTAWNFAFGGRFFY